MKLLELEINNVRGIRQCVLKPSSKNFVIWGPNGSGKSGVVDSLDFLLTGRISRLMGKGTGDITLNTHGPHVDCKPEDAIIRAIISIPGKKEPVEIKRCFDHPNNLICDQADLPLLQPIIDIAKRGQHVLTRREILKYVTSDGSTRAEEIQELLNITEIEDIRKTLIKIKGDFDKELKLAKNALETAKATVVSTVQQSPFQAELVLEVVNQNRAILGADPLTKLTYKDLKTGIIPTATTSSQKINVTIVEGDIKNLRNLFSDHYRKELSTIDASLRALIEKVRSNPELLRSLSREELITLGMQLIDEDGNCPLCDTAWSPGELYNYLKKKTEQASSAAHFKAEANRLSSSIVIRIKAVVESIGRIIAAAKLSGVQNGIAILEEWQTQLNILSGSLSKVLEKYPLADFPVEAIQQLLAPSNLEEMLQGIQACIKEKFPESTPEQTAWDTLTRLEENLKGYEKADTDFERAKTAFARANTLVVQFEQARDSVLINLYNDIKDRFVSLYKQLHGTDEDCFQAQLRPEGAALKFEVDFYGRGSHPPHALHSEGHQDSMGLCLYLALAERLTGGLIELTILDDVVMSVDADHRRELCHVLATAFPNRQFLITTHDKTWAAQLRTEKVVNSKGSIEFYNWKVETGPQISYEVDAWEKIKADLDKNDVPNAAARLRRSSEEYFRQVCDSLRAEVVFRVDGRWELGELLPRAVAQYKHHLGKAKEAANSWSHKELVERLREYESVITQVYERTNAENWAVNANVHYNSWAKFEKMDFVPVVEAFQDLFNIFTCSNCGKLLYVTSQGIKPISLRCDCGRVNWDFVVKEK